MTQKPNILQYFHIYLLHIDFLSKTFYVPVKSYPRATFHVLVAKVYVVI